MLYFIKTKNLTFENLWQRKPSSSCVPVPNVYLTCALPWQAKPSSSSQYWDTLLRLRAESELEETTHAYGKVACRLSCICMCVCVCVCTHTHTHTHSHTHTHTHTHTRTHTHTHAGQAAAAVGVVSG
jgi:hypothetical protein